MNKLKEYHQNLGANLADDGIPLHYGDLKAEYQSALDHTILLDRSHEGRILLTGDDRFELVNRMSTNKIVEMAPDEGRATVFTNPNARVLYRAVCYNRPEGLLLITEPGQGQALSTYLQRNIFFNDKVQQQNLTNSTAQFALHGVTADSVMEQLHGGLSNLAPLHSAEITSNGVDITVVRGKNIIGNHWNIICPVNDAIQVHQLLREIGEKDGLIPAGSLTFNILRIRSGRPAGRELSQDYIPLEVGLWDEISFAKGCYTGQEIIARMESRERIAKTIVKVDLSTFVNAPAKIFHQGKQIGMLTSSATSPTGDHFAIAVLKTDYAKSGTVITIGGENIPATVTEFAGVQPTFIHPT